MASFAMQDPGSDANVNSGIAEQNYEKNNVTDIDTDGIRTDQVSNTLYRFCILIHNSQFTISLVRSQSGTFVRSCNYSAHDHDHNQNPANR